MGKKEQSQMGMGGMQKKPIIKGFKVIFSTQGSLVIKSIFTI